MRRELDLLADFTLDVWLVAKFAPSLGTLALDGRTWERAVFGLLYRPGFTRRQGPGSLTLFDSESASGVPHEIDGAAVNRRGSFIVECKATGDGITKADAALFHYKVMDFYHRRVAISSRERWWRFLCGTAPTADSARAAALSLGLLICDPARLPLPVLLRTASRPSADMHLPETLLQELVRLGERALCPQQERWRYRTHSREIGFDPNHWGIGQIQDLLWLEDELTGYLLDLFETRRPGLLEKKARTLISQLKKVA